MPASGKAEQATEGVGETQFGVTKDSQTAAYYSIYNRNR